VVGVPRGRVSTHAGPRPVYLLAGGPGARSRRRDPVLAAALAEAGVERPSVAYVGAASQDDRGFFRWIAGALQRAGAGDVHLAALTSPRADVAKAKATMAGSDLVFVSGGDVEAGMERLGERGVVGFLRELHAGGKPFVGVSAGSIMLAAHWVRWRDANDDASAETFPCLGLAPVVCDTHAEADDWDELRTLLALTPGGVGYGIPTGAVLRVGVDGGVAAVGMPVCRLERRGGRTHRLPDLEPL
jgi:peptidase E